jgi:hypothetical protein
MSKILYGKHGKEWLLDIITFFTPPLTGANVLIGHCHKVSEKLQYDTAELNVIECILIQLR